MKRTVLLALLLAGCATTAERPTEPPPVQTAPAIEAPPARTHAVDITVSEQAGDQWLVTYRFAKPVRGVAFERQTNQFRAAKWSFAGDDKGQWSWTTRGKQEVVSAAQPFNELKFAFQADTDEKTADYLLNAAFSDGSRLFYSGHLAVRLLGCASGDTCAASELQPGPALSIADYEWHFETTPGRDIQVLAERATQKLDWTQTKSTPEDGTYAYFGSIKARETEFGTLILDPGLPKWMLESGEAAIPKLLAWYGQDTGVKLSVRPLILVSSPKSEKRGLNSKGGVVGGLVQVAVWGEGWQTESKETREKWLKFFAHELFHFWNGEMFQRRDDEKEAWLSEGSSDYFAYRALRGIGVLDDAGVAKRVAEDVNQCLIRLKQGRPLVGEPMPERPEYFCGSALWAIADGVAQAHGQHVGSVLGGVLAKAGSSAQYTTDDVVRALRALEPTSKPLDLLERVLRQGLPTDAAEVAFLDALGRPYAFELAKPSLAPQQSTPMQTFITEAARCDCNQRVSANTSLDGVLFNDIPECNKLRAVKVVGVGKYTFPKDGALALDELLARKDKRRIDLATEKDGRKGKLQLTCRDDYEPLPFSRLLAPKAATAP